MGKLCAKFFDDAPLLNLRINSLFHDSVVLMLDMELDTLMSFLFGVSCFKNISG